MAIVFFFFFLLATRGNVARIPRLPSHSHLLTRVRVVDNLVRFHVDHLTRMTTSAVGRATLGNFRPLAPYACRTKSARGSRTGDGQLYVHEALSRMADRRERLRVERNTGDPNTGPGCLIPYHAQTKMTADDACLRVLAMHRRKSAGHFTNTTARK